MPNDLGQQRNFNKATAAHMLDAYTVLDAFLSSDRALVIQINTAVDIDNVSRVYGITLNEDDDLQDPFDCYNTYADHERLSCHNLQEIQEILEYVHARNVDKLSNIGFDFNGTLIPLEDPSVVIEEDLNTALEKLQKITPSSLDDHAPVVV